MYVVSHFLNEELLLPFWLRHHVPLFDHGVMIDYGSTDRSVEIIRELAPKWEIRKTKAPRFAEPFIGDEVMAIEQEFPTTAWKAAINVTEFLVCADLRAFVSDFEKAFPNLPGFKATGVLMVDSPEEEQSELIGDAPLLLQRAHGIVERRGETNPVIMGVCYKPSRCRFIHRIRHGGYLAGRHEIDPNIDLRDIDRKFGLKPNWNTDLGTTLAWQGVMPGIYVAWFGRWSPFSEVFRERTAALDLHVPRYSPLGGLPATPTDTSILEKEVAWVRQRYYNVWEQEPLYYKALHPVQVA